MISVLMSVYNETLQEIRQSVDSVLSQTYKDFELIIVLDQPAYTEGLVLLNEYAASDSRVRILVNEKNIGLALSMNHAANHAWGEYLLRMDADDICMPERFQLEHDALCDGKYDLICGNYVCIDEDGNPLPQKTPVYTDRQLEALLPYRNIIHHPTVLMRASCFHEVGGYRNYPCAQDYDLWLRMKCAGCKMHMLQDVLIQYRIRQSSTTFQKRYKQSCTGDYVRKLYRQRNNMRGYSHEGYLAYLDKRQVQDPAANEDFIENFNRYMQSKQELKRGHIIAGMTDLCKVLFCSKYYRPRIHQSVMIAGISKFVR